MLTRYTPIIFPEGVENGAQLRLVLCIVDTTNKRFFIHALNMFVPCLTFATMPQFRWAAPRRQQFWGADTKAGVSHRDDRRQGTAQIRGGKLFAFGVDFFF